MKGRTKLLLLGLVALPIISFLYVVFFGWMWFFRSLLGGALFGVLGIVIAYFIPFNKRKRRK